MTTKTGELVTVTKQSPCPICKKPDWCGVSDKVVVCMRIQSQRPAKNGGWVHRINDFSTQKNYRYVPMPKIKKTFHFTVLAHEFRREITWEKICLHAKELGVTPESLDALSIGFNEKQNAYAFPMFDANENIVGIRLRNVEGKKWAVKGSRVGLFYDNILTPHDRKAYICEGPTDTASMISLGFWAVGRAACLGQADQLRDLFKRLRVNKIVVVADNDAPKNGPFGEFFPGKEGALKLINELKIQAKMIMPPLKDIRAWVKNGITKNDILYLENQQSWRFF